MALLNMRGVSVAFGGPLLLDQVDFRIEPGERVCLMGRNGAGKSTLLKILCGEIAPDGGEIVRQQGLKVARVPQEAPPGLVGAVHDIVFGDHEGSLRSVDEHHREADKAISRLGLDPDAVFETLSGGIQRRVLIARALCHGSDFLLLDEPTNHLDIDAIAWLEGFLLRGGPTLLFITHDRMFLRKVATRIVELDRGKLYDWECGYDLFLERREAALAAEATQREKFDKRLAEEEVWIRKGIKARGTRNEGRVRALKAMREERRVRRDTAGVVKMAAGDASASGKVVVEATGVCAGYGDGPDVIRDCTTTILRGDRVGIIGPNGSGKTTLIRTLLGEMPPRSGVVKVGTRLEVAYSDQLRELLDDDKSVAENVGEGNDTVTVNGRSRHVIGYLQDFLFPPDRARSPVRILSGGERNRLQLAKLFTKPFNLLVLDEPTNDLDLETLDLLEELLMDYSGTLILVSHDRAFLNNVVTSTLVVEADGRVSEYVGGYDDWVAQRTKAVSSTASSQGGEGGSDRSKREAPKKLSYKEQRAIEELPKRIKEAEGEIARLEAERDDLHVAMADPSFYREEAARIAQSKARLVELEAEVARAYARWEALEAVLAAASTST